jgi:hypothetical protein
VSSTVAAGDWLTASIFETSYSDYVVLFNFTYVCLSTQ